MALTQSSRMHSTGHLVATIQDSQTHVCHMLMMFINHALIMRESSLKRKWVLCFFVTSQKVE